MHDGRAAGAKNWSTSKASAIGPIKKIDAMVPGFTVSDKATTGKQVPEQFEGAAKDTLTTAIVGGLLRTDGG